MTSEQRKNKRRQAHRNFTKSYWRQAAREEDTSWEYSPENITRMKMGKAPRRLALIEHVSTGERIEYHAPVELHHVFGMQEDTPQEDQTIVELWPWQHAATDPDRKFSWEFVEWRGFQ